jgi:hypothetical protein
MVKSEKIEEKEKEAINSWRSALISALIIPQRLFREGLIR